MRETAQLLKLKNFATQGRDAREGATGERQPYHHFDDASHTHTHTHTNREEGATLTIRDGLTDERHKDTDTYRVENREIRVAGWHR